MTILISDPSLPQIEGITRRTLLQRFLDETGFGETGVATAGGAGTFDDTATLKSSQYDSKKWVGGWARISQKTSSVGTAPETEVNPITTYDPTTNGRITVNPVWTSNPAAGDFYELWSNPNPKRVIRMLDELLQEEIYIPCWSVLTEVPDGDMEQSTATGDWTAVNATVAKATAEPALYGKRYLTVVATSANGYARSKIMRCEPSKSYHISAVCRANATATTCQLEVYDETNSASIGTVQSNRQYPVRLKMDISMPATCYQYSIRLTTVENTKTTSWDSVVAYSRDATDIRLPWWVKDKNQVIGILTLESASIAPASGGTISESLYDYNLRGDLEHGWDIQDRFYGGGQLKLQSRYGPISNPMFILGIRNEEAYTDDNTDKKKVDSNLLIACLKYKVYDFLVTRGSGGQTNNATFTQARDSAYKTWRQLEAVQRTSLEQTFQSPTPPMFINTDRMAGIRY